MRIVTDNGFRNVMGMDPDSPAPLMWKWLVLHRDGGCVMAPDGCDGEIQAHHIITQQKLRKCGATDEQMWDVRNGMGLCERHHRRHTRALTRVPFSLLRPEAFEFADELGLRWTLERYYDTREAA